MKLALCLEYPIDQQGGTEVLVSELIRGLGETHEILLVSPDDAASLARSKIARFVRQHISWQPQEISPDHSRLLAKQLAEAGVDLAHFHFGGVYAWGNRFPFQCPVYHLSRLGVPCVSTIHRAVNLLEGYCGPQKPVWFKLLMLPLAWCGKMQQLRHVQYEIAVSQRDLRTLQKYYWPARGRFTQIYHSRLRDGLSNVTQTEREPVILNVGHLARCKGQITLVKAFAQLAGRHPAWKLELAGYDGGEGIAAEIQALAKANGLADRILCLGQRDDALNLMQCAGIYVQPSNWEALGLALQEAMYCGCPAIGSRVGGIPELIDADRTGLLCEPGNVSQLSALLEDLINDQPKRQRLGQAAAQSIRDRGMTAEAMIKRHVELYESAAKKS